MQALLARGASVAATNGAQMTPLLVAAFARKTAVVEALLAAGADVIAPLCALSSVLPEKRVTLRPLTVEFGEFYSSR